MRTCDNCRGEGQIISAVTGNYDECRVCRGEGELNVCANFNAITNRPGFRNQRCGNCNVREADHQVLTVA